MKEFQSRKQEIRFTGKKKRQSRYSVKWQEQERPRQKDWRKAA